MATLESGRSAQSTESNRLRGEPRGGTAERLGGGEEGVSGDREGSDNRGSRESELEKKKKRKKNLVEVEMDEKNGGIGVEGVLRERRRVDSDEVGRGSLGMERMEKRNLNVVDELRGKQRNERQSVLNRRQERQQRRRTQC